MNIENKYLLSIQQLPEDVIKYIKEFIPLSCLVWLDKKTYLKNHHIKVVIKIIPILNLSSGEIKNLKQEIQIM